MNIRQISLFVAVLEEGSFTGAAARYGTAQPAVSAAIQRLEQDLGAQLFVRGVRPPALTPEGKAFLRHSRAILAAIDASRAEVRALHEGRAGSVRLGVPPMVAAYLLPPIISAFMKERPGVRITVVQQGAETVRESVFTGGLDFGLIAESRNVEGIDTCLLQMQPIVALVPAKSKLAGARTLSWEQLIEEPLILFPEGYFQRLRIEQEVARTGRALKIAAETESVELMLELVRKGIGAATVLGAVPVSAEIRAIPLKDEASVPLALCRRTGAPQSGAAASLYDFIHERLSR